VEALEERNAPSDLDLTGIMTATDPQPTSDPTVAVATTTPAVTTVTTPAATPTAVPTAPLPAVPLPVPQTAPLTAAPVVDAGITAPAAGAPVIADMEQQEGQNWIYTITGDTTGNAASVQFSNAELDGKSVPVTPAADGSGTGTFQVTFELAPCTSATTADHTYAVVAVGAGGQKSAPVPYTVHQTVSVRPAA
jgi:hypothetical protein